MAHTICERCASPGQRILKAFHSDDDHRVLGGCVCVCVCWGFLLHPFLWMCVIFSYIYYTAALSNRPTANRVWRAVQASTTGNRFLNSKWFIKGFSSPFVASTLAIEIECRAVESAHRIGQCTRCGVLRCSITAGVKCFSIDGDALWWFLVLFMGRFSISDD